MSNTIHAFEYLTGATGEPTGSACVLFGDEPFLKRLVLKQLRAAVLGGDADDVPYVTMVGKEAQWRDVADELSTVSLFSAGPRLVVIDEADPFVTANRDKLEHYVAQPSSTGCLVLDVETWASNTRLYKAIDKTGLPIDCRAPQRKQGKRNVLDEGRLLKWLAAWATEEHDARLDPTAAALMLDLVGPELGILDSELAKLSLFAGPGGTILPEMVRDVVGGWRTKSIWDLVDAAAMGNADQALAGLDRLLQMGEQPHALFAQIAWSLRRFAAATRIYQQAQRRRQRISLPQALEQAGFRPWPRQALTDAEKQLRQLGRDRAGSIYRWLLEADLALKGSHSQLYRARFVLEQLIVRLAKEAKEVELVSYE